MTITNKVIGGTAGCAVAGRLAENPKVSVLIIEAGIDNPGDVDAITTPARAFELRNSKYDWSYKTGMIDRPEYTRIEKPNTRGKVLGGSSCLNYYTWIPGSAATFDDWAPYGGEEWTWKSCKEYLYKARRLRRFQYIMAIMTNRGNSLLLTMTIAVSLARNSSISAREARFQSPTPTSSQKSSHSATLSPRLGSAKAKSSLTMCIMVP